MYMTYQEEEGTEKLHTFDEYVRIKRNYNDRIKKNKTKPNTPTESI